MATHILGGSLVTDDAPLEVQDANRSSVMAAGVALSGRKTVTAAGTPVRLGSQVIDGPIMVKAMVTNTGYIYIGNNGSNTVGSTTGLTLVAGDVVIFDHVSNLNVLWLDSTVNGEGVSWLALRV